MAVFVVGASHNILRVGLIELAELLNYENSLCGRYLEVLLSVGTQIRADVLNTAIIKYSPVVYGGNSFAYRLTGAPLAWNSIGVARGLEVQLKTQGRGELERPHL
jgi:hypothetical protein